MTHADALALGAETVEALVERLGSERERHANYEGNPPIFSWVHP